MYLDETEDGVVLRTANQAVARALARQYTGDNPDASLTIPSGNNAGSTCPMNCASRILPWAAQCASDPQYQQLDSTNLLTNFRAMCMSTMAGGQNQAGGPKERPPAGGGH